MNPSTVNLFARIKLAQERMRTKAEEMANSPDPTLHARAGGLLLAVRIIDKECFAADQDGYVSPPQTDTEHNPEDRDWDSEAEETRRRG